ncbi:ABC transporter ATP-binding protein [Acinetobacter bereziniae]|uniref:ABC transporter ATP-binding protein n=1 Tax=Acinetobacter bereziniae TaxID=106648 RepID=UPI00125FC3A5|nr:ABC transporter ATP-binding protein [Acinetobacter bereziniae]
MKKILLLAILLTQQVFAEETYVSGRISDITSITEGLLIRLETREVPRICENRNPWGYLIIPQARKTILATTLMNWGRNKQQVTLYVDENQGSASFCTIKQIDHKD